VIKGITRKNGRGLWRAVLDAGDWAYVCERSIQSGRRERMVCIRMVLCRHVFFFFFRSEMVGGCDGFGGVTGGKRE